MIEIAPFVVQLREYIGKVIEIRSDAHENIDISMLKHPPRALIHQRVTYAFAILLLLV